MHTVRTALRIPARLLVLTVAAPGAGERTGGDKLRPYETWEITATVPVLVRPMERPTKNFLVSAPQTAAHGGAPGAPTWVAF